MSKRPIDVRLGAVLAVTASVVLALGTGQRSSAEAPSCTKYASPSGRNSNSGTFEKPYRTITYLLGRVHAGATGCLLPGEFDENVWIRSGGAPGQPVTLASALSVRATINGTIWVAASADDVVISDLRLNGWNTTGRASPMVNGNRVSLLRNDITNGHAAICVLLGPGFEDPPMRAIDPVVDRNRIHDCGRLPPTGHDHGVYVEGTTNARITNNVIYDNADYGIHLYPDADGSIIASNVIDGNAGGFIFAGERGGGEYEFPHSSDENVVKNNIFSSNAGRNNLESWWGGPTGTDNVVFDNCFWNGLPEDIEESEGGFIHVDDMFADPLYVNRAGKDFTLQPDSPCAGKGPGGTGDPSSSAGLQARASGRDRSPSR
jgi:parallel beta-helix repeat protein